MTTALIVLTIYVPLGGWSLWHEWRRERLARAVILRRLSWQG